MTVTCNVFCCNQSPFHGFVRTFLGFAAKAGTANTSGFLSAAPSAAPAIELMVEVEVAVEVGLMVGKGKAATAGWIADDGSDPEPEPEPSGTRSIRAVVSMGV